MVSMAYYILFLISFATWIWVIHDAVAFLDKLDLPHVGFIKSSMAGCFRCTVVSMEVIGITPVL